MTLRARIFALFVAAAALVAASVALPALLVLDENEDRLLESRTAQQEAELRLGIDRAADPLAARARLVAGDPALRAALAARDESALRARLAALVAAHPTLAAAARIDVISASGELLATAPAGTVEAPLVAAGMLLREMGPDDEPAGLERGPDGLWLVISLRAGSGGLVALAEPAAPAFGAISASLGAPIVLRDTAARPIFATDPALLAEIGRIRPGEAHGQPTLDRGGRRFLLVETPLYGSAGARIGEALVLRDTTRETRRRALVMLVAAGLLASAAAATGVLLYRTMRATLDPLTDLAQALRAVAGGDLFASAAVPARADEVGAIAAALEALRATGLALERLETGNRVARAQQQALIRGEMARLADVLDPEERAELDRLLQPQAGAAEERVGATLAAAFRRMSAQVQARQRRLADLLEARTRDLALVQEALAERIQLNRLREELEVARQLQMSSVPTVFPDLPAFALHAAMLPAKEVGGDFYDFALLGADRIALFVGDASGKGVGAAIFIAMARSLLRAAVMRGARPGEALAQANDALAADNPRMMFATVFVGIIDLASGTMSYANAGHNPPLRRRGDAVDIVAGTGDIALGILEGAEFVTSDLSLLPGDTLLLFSDGITEAVGPDEALFGDPRLQARFADLAALPPAGAVAALNESVAVFAADMPQADDITTLVFAYHGPQAG